MGYGIGDNYPPTPYVPTTQQMYANGSMAGPLPDLSSDMDMVDAVSAYWAAGQLVVECS